ncbi:MAG: Ppx/GppA phosphatase family protein [Alphaproteobacteria bacterium]
MVEQAGAVTTPHPKHQKSKLRNKSFARMKSQTPTYAALDLGTNNCRLLIAKPELHPGSRKLDRPYYGESGMPFRVIDAFSRIVRLGEGLARTGKLNDHAIERTLTALTICASKMRRRRVTMARCIATEACRRALNCDDFLRRVREETQLNLEIVSGEEEAALGLIGCLPLLNHKLNNALIFDIGGGSTEISWLAKDQNNEFDLVDTISIPFGVVTLTESYGGQYDPKRTDGGTLDPRAYQDIKHHVSKQLEAFDAIHNIAQHMRAGNAQMVGTSGTVTTLSGIHLRLRRYDRSVVDGTYLSTHDMRKIMHELGRTSNNGRAAYPCIGPRRSDLVLPGCAILEAILDLWPIEGLRVADRGLREGMLYTMATNNVQS